VKLVPGLLIPALIAGFASRGTGQVPAKWLVIAGSSQSVEAAISVEKGIKPEWPHVTIVASGDCESLRPNLFLTVAAMAPDRGAADAALQKLKLRISDAYIRECRPKPYTALIWGLPLIDPSIQNVPADAVNWSEQDRVSTLIRLSEAAFLWVRRSYVHKPNDALEGRRESVFFFEQNPQNRIELKAECVDPFAILRSQWVALSCAQAVAGDYLLHEVTVFNTRSGSALYTAPHCRKPAFVSDSEITCEKEGVNAEGKLTLQSETIKFR